MNYAKFIEKLNELQNKGLLDASSKYDVMDWAKDLHQEGFERGILLGREIERG
jgi:hypothetical protein